MTIEKGEDWGGRGRLPENAPIVASDHDLATLWRPDGPTPIVGLVGGDLHRTVGGRATEADLRSGERTVLPIDVGLVHLGEKNVPFVAHLVRRKRFWAGTTIAVMNSGFLGHWNVAPRGHPNDGRLDLIESNLSFGDRIKARPRLPAGGHVPHPDISIRRLRSGTIDVGHGAWVEVDGQRMPVPERFEWSVVPDAMSIVI